MTKYNVVIGTCFGKKQVDFYPIGELRDTLTHEGMVSIHRIKDAKYYVFDSNSKEIYGVASYGRNDDNPADKTATDLIKTSFEKMQTHHQKHTFESISDHMLVSKWLYKSCCHTEWQQRE